MWCLSYASSPQRKRQSFSEHSLSMRAQSHKLIVFIRPAEKVRPASVLAPFVMESCRGWLRGCCQPSVRRVGETRYNAQVADLQTACK